ncbi:hypothetical protein [Nostoc sp.]
MNHLMNFKAVDRLVLPLAFALINTCTGRLVVLLQKLTLDI